MAYTFGASDLLEDLGFDPAKLEIQSDDVDSKKDEAVATGRHGDTIESTQYNARDEFQIRAVVADDNVSGIEVELGGVGYGDAEPKIVITAVEVRQPPNDFAEVTFTCHRHTGASKAHVARVYTVTLPAMGFGIQTGNPTGLSGITAISVNDYTWKAQIDHKDRTARDGAYLIGGSTNGRLDETVGMVDNADTIAAASGWKIDSSKPSTNNQGYKIRTVACHKFIAADV